MVDEHEELLLVILWIGFEVILHLAMMEYYVLYLEKYLSLCKIDNSCPA
jgi:hypothetical protein